jgi:Predicted transcriptional regulators
MTNKEIESLISLGLTEREAKVYMVLLGLKGMTASALPKFANIPRTKIYEVLISLGNKGFCKELDHSSKKKVYAAVNPRIALNGIIEREEERLYSMRVKNQQLITFLSNIYDNNAARLSNYDFIEVLKGKHEIAEKYMELRSGVKTELVEFTKGPYAMNNADINAEVNETRQLINRGVKMQVLYEAEAIEEDSVVSKAIIAHIDIGVESKSLPFVPIKMCLFDNATIMLTLDDPIDISSQLTAVVIKDVNLCNVLKQAFQMYWMQGKPLSRNNYHSQAIAR